MIEFIEHPGSEPIKSLELRNAFAALGPWSPPELIMVGNTQHAIVQAMVEFRGRDWRRIKREVRKAIKLSRRR